MLLGILFCLLSVQFEASFSFIVDENFRSNIRAAEDIQRRSDDNVCQTEGCNKSAQEILANMDETVNPCEDFYKFSCGGYISKKTIPEDKSEIGVFQDIQDELNSQIRALLDKPLAGTEPKYVKIIKHAFDSCMNTDQIEEAGSEPLKKTLSSLGGWPVLLGDDWDSSKFDWIESLLAFRRLGLNFNIILTTFVMTDLKNNTAYAIYLDQTDLGMPDREYLVKGLDDPATKAYFDLMVKSAVKLGAAKESAEKELLAALNFEMALANFTRKEEDRRNTTELYNKYTIKNLTESIPQTDWYKLVNGLFKQLISPLETLIVLEPNFVRKMSELITSTDKRVLANYMMWRVFKEVMPQLSKEWREIAHEYDAVVTGVAEEKPRWEVCLQSFEVPLKIALSAYYVGSYFQEESKEKSLEMVGYLRKEFQHVLETIDWMEESTRQKALEKANAITPYIGYPSEIKNDTLITNYYQNLTITPDNYFSNMLNLNIWNTDDMFSKIRTVSQKGDWEKHGYVAVVNAFYNSFENSIDFPAGILQKHFFNKDRPTYMNFGAIGYVIGHEVTHGFDDMGRQFDKEGNTADWWDKGTDEKFRNKAQCIIDQYGNYTTETGLKVNGQNTIGENLADNGGIKQAYQAYQAWVKDHGPEPKLPGLKYTPEQMLLISFANVWCAKIKPEALKLSILTDPHSPTQFRVNGAVSNLPEFSKEFECPPGSPMNPAQKCKVW